MTPELQTRLKTAGILILAVAILIVLSVTVSWGRFLLMAVALVAVQLATMELGTFSFPNTPRRILSPAWFWAMLAAGAPSLVTAALVIGKSGCSSGTCAVTPVGIVVPLLLGLFAAVMGLVFQSRHVLEAGQRWFAETMVAWVLLGLGGASLVALSTVPQSGGFWITWLIVVVAVNDSAAYFGGRAFGGPKLAPAISPKKTLSGSFCGLCGGALAAIGLAGLIMPAGEDVYLAALVGVLVVIMAQLGDLLKSYLKRLHNTKDSGNLLPGHGGVLDRIDGVLGAAPVVYVVWTMLY